jgi:hypothetical protein
MEDEKCPPKKKEKSFTWISIKCYNIRSFFKRYYIIKCDVDVLLVSPVSIQVILIVANS